MIENHVDENAVAAALDRTLSADDAYAVFDHVHGCDACRERWAGLIEADALLAASAADVPRRDWGQRMSALRRVAVLVAAAAAAGFLWARIPPGETSTPRSAEVEKSPRSIPILDPATARAQGFVVHELVVTTFVCDRSGQMTATLRLDALGVRRLTQRIETKLEHDDDVVVRSVEETYGDRP